MVVPVCECPSCHKLGLHYMPYQVTESRVEYKMANWVQLVEVPVVQWYDDREEKPLTELRTRKHTGYREIEKETTYIYRECWYCAHQWTQTWKEETVG